ncbi:MAG: toprim domain-containing protein, partial [Pseudomonadota bacterium]
QGPGGEAARKAGTLLVAEGYMDVIALAQAGFTHAVAPLGTAVTEEQLGLLWRQAEEPIVALDGDRAGLRAADRLVDLALPLLAPGKSLRFCLMPEGQDPDDLIKAGGPPAMAEALAGALPLVDMLWRREAEAEPLDTPERRAALDQRLRQALGRIADQSVRNHYAAALRERRAALFQSTQPRQPAGRASRGRWKPPQGPVSSTKNSDLARSGGQAEAARIREAAILLIAAHNPAHLAPLEAQLEEVPLVTPDYLGVRDALLGALSDPETDLTAAIETLSRVPQARAHPMAREVTDGARLTEVLADAISRHAAQLSLEAELAEAARDLPEADGEDWTWRLRQARQQRLAIDQRALEEEAAAESPAETSDLQRMLDQRLYQRKKKGHPPTNR